MKTKIIKIIIIVYCSLFTVHCFSQTWEWAQRAGGTQPDQAFGIAVDKQGNSYVAGEYLSFPAIFGNDTLQGNGYTELFVAKYDSNGNLLWAKRAGGLCPNQAGSDVNYANGITVDSLGNCYITGSVAGSNPVFDTINLPSAGNGKLFIAKYNTAGACIWVRTVGDGIAYEISGNSISINKNKSLFITGYFSGTATFGTYQITAHSSTFHDAFIAKYDLNGNCIWVRQGNSIAGGSSISSDVNGNCYVTGTFDSTATFGSYTLTSLGGGDIFVAKYDSLGNCKWAKSGGSSNDDYGTGISADAFGNSYITGAFTGSVATFGTFTLTGGTIFIVKYDSIGNCKWAKQANGTGGAEGYGIVTDKTGNLNIAGQGGLVNFGSCSLSNNGSFITKFDSSGNCLWIQEFNALVTGVGAIALDTSDVSYITGGFQNTATFGSTILTSAGQTDVFVAKLKDSATGAQPYNKKSSSFVIYPNPSDGSYTMVISKDLLKSQMYIYDAIGDIIFQTTLSENYTTINIPNLAQGVYIVKLQTPDGNSLQQNIVRN